MLPHPHFHPLRRWTLLISILTLLLPSPSLADLAAGELAALFSLRSSLGLRARDWPRRSDPCTSWSGVACALPRHVTSLSLSGLRRTRLGRANPRFAVEGLRNLTRLALFNASGFPLPGPIPDSLGDAVSLTVLDLSRNEITGDIPSSLGRLGNLSSLDLSGNKLTGAVPQAITSVPGLKTLNLAGNRLNGSLPPQLGDLASIIRLDLSRNNFSGALPDSLWSLPKMEFLDVSENNLTGKLPRLVPANAGGSTVNLSNNLFYGPIASGFGIFLDKFNSSDVSGNYFDGLLPVDDGIRNLLFEMNCFRNASKQRIPGECEEFYRLRGLPYDGIVSPNASSPPGSHKGIWSLKYILIVVFAGIGVLGVLILVVVLYLMRRGTKAGEERETSANPVPSGTGEPTSGTSANLSAVGDSFTYEQLLRATAEFNDSNLIKRGHSGDLYRGVLGDEVPVVVKRIDVRVVKDEAYVAELGFFAKVSHERLVPFVGQCLENENEKLLVYKYMRNGDLSNALYRKPRQEEEDVQSLDWITRLKIATGVAEALCFLHHECSPPLIHRDIQASSILLDDKFEVRLGSLSEVCTQTGDSHQNVITRFLRLSTKKSDRSASGSPSATCAYDVYCLGKVLLGLVTGKLGVSDPNEASAMESIEVAMPFISTEKKELVTKIVDPSLIVDEDLLEEVWAIAIVARSCLHLRPSRRPPVRYVLKALQNPLKVVRENWSGSSRSKSASSRGSGQLGSRRRSSSDNNGEGGAESQGSGGGEHSFSRKKASNEIFPEPSGEREAED